MNECIYRLYPHVFLCTLHLLYDDPSSEGEEESKAGQPWVLPAGLHHHVGLGSWTAAQKWSVVREITTMGQGRHGHEGVAGAGTLLAQGGRCTAGGMGGGEGEVVFHGETTAHPLPAQLRPAHHCYTLLSEVV